jgi:hypothetical protein
MARTQKDKKVKHIDPNKIKTRDWYMVLIINGATKGGVIPDRRKDRNKYSCRGRQGRWSGEDT